MLRRAQRGHKRPRTCGDAGFAHQHFCRHRDHAETHVFDYDKNSVSAHEKSVMRRHANRVMRLHHNSHDAVAFDTGQND